MKKFGLLILCILSMLLSIAQTQQVKKYVSVELFTNTWCGLCAFYDPPAIETYLANKADVHLISVHPNVPYPQCPFYNANPTDNLARRTYNAVSGTPRTFTNGTQQNTGSGMLTQNLIDSNIGQYSALRIAVSEIGFSTTKTVTVNIKSFETLPAGDWRLYVTAVVELVNFDAQNGLTEHHNVLWQFLTSENGDPITPAALHGTVSQTFQYDTNNLTHSSFDANQVYTIAFIQNNDTKEVINSGSSKDIIIDAAITAPTCGETDGSIDLNISGGSGNYGIFWAQGAFTETVNNLAEGTYSVVVTDNLGASVTNQFTISCCTENLNLQGNQLNDEVYKASNTITSTAIITADIEYKAGQRIQLNNGFTTKTPNNFGVKIEEGCD